MGRRRAVLEYKGFEQGPIRPPSEAGSLLIRITRNCPWNRCTFCPVYKGTEFSLRPVEHVLEDINAVHGYVLAIRESAAATGKILPADIHKITSSEREYDRVALNAALNWAVSGMQSIFLQDANSLIIKPENLITILKHLHGCFPWVERITSYARSHTIARISDENLDLIAGAGLNRIHIGMESGSDKVLSLMKKGADKATHIKAGLKVKRAGMELSEYVMPGLGGAEFSKAHAVETADALNKINPDFIRLRTLAIPEHIELYQDYESGNFKKLTDLETAKELLLFLRNLEAVTGTLKSDHVLNLFEDLEGKLPEDKVEMEGMIESFLKMSPEDRVVYQMGRRMGFFRGVRDMADINLRNQAEEKCRHFKISPENADRVIDELMKRFI